MNYVSFIIENFKGIQKLNLSFEKTHNSPIILLVGLNESGKTTILETLSFFFDNIKKDQEIRLTSNVVDDVHDLIPKGEKDNFNKSILIKTHIIISNNDKMKGNYIHDGPNRLVLPQPLNGICWRRQRSNISFKIWQYIRISLRKIIVSSLTKPNIHKILSKTS